MVQSFILRLERVNRVTEHLDCYKIELIQNYHDLVSFSVIGPVSFSDPGGVMKKKLEKSRVIRVDRIVEYVL